MISGSKKGQMKTPIELIRDIAKKCRCKSLPNKYYGDVEDELIEIERISKELLRYYERGTKRTTRNVG